MKAKAIETTIDGHKMRSRLEARWAMFFNALGIEWKYEPEGYSDGVTAYLPDFLLPTLDYFIEIKPTIPTPHEIHKAGIAAIACKRPVFILYGDLPTGREWINDSAMIVCPSHDGDYWNDNGYHWTECGRCGFVGMTPPGKRRWERLHCACEFGGGGDDTLRLVNAYDAARTARFEHGVGVAAHFNMLAGGLSRAGR